MMYCGRVVARNDLETWSVDPAADDPVLQDLRNAYESEQLILFVGPEVSVAAGLPDWKRLAERLVERLRSRGGASSDIDEAQDLAQKQKYMEALSAIKLSLGAPEFCSTVERALDDRNLELPDIARAIASMRSRLRAVLTTNLDRLLERAFEGEWDVLSRATADIASRRKYILKLYGTLHERDTWVLTREQHDRVLFATPALQTAVKALFHVCPILFVGFDLDDDQMDRNLGEVRALSGEQPPAHFALLPTRSITPFRRRKLEAAGLRLILYDDHDGEVARLPAILRSIATSTTEPDTDPFAGRAIHAIDDFLMHVERVCRLKEPPDARIERLRAPGPFRALLRVSVRRGRIVRTTPVAAVEQRVTEELLEAFLTGIDAQYRRDDPGLISTLVYRGTSPPETLIEKAERARVSVESFIEYQGLLDFTHYLQRQTRRIESDPVYPPELYVDQRLTYRLGLDAPQEADAVTTLTEWLDSPRGRFVVVLGDFGTGKTFLLHELARRMAKAGGLVVPILVEMRSLEKGRTLEELVAQHFARASFERFQMEAFLYMLSEGRIALLFDGFDELALRVSFDRAEEHFDTLIQAAAGNAKVVVTSRTQHFLSDRRVETALAKRAGSIPGYRLAKLSPFTPDQIRRFLTNRFGIEAAERRFAMLGSIKDLMGLSANPRMLGFIAAIDEQKLEAVKAGQGEVTSAGLYRVLIEEWLSKEDDRLRPRGAEGGLTPAQRRRAVVELAMELWRSRERTIDITALPAEVVHTVQQLAKNKLDAGTVQYEVGAGTLLVRDEDGRFSFIHQSVLEWLVAHRAAEELAAGTEPAALGMRDLSELMADFFAALAGKEAAVKWAQAALAPGSREVVANNALLVLHRLGIEGHRAVSLAGHDLRGRDLSGQDLRGADLTGADLTSARLVGADLRDACLRDAKLVRADLSRAQAERADMSGADLSFARLLSANLRDAKFAGARLVATELVGAELNPAALDDSDTIGIASPEPAHIEPVIMSASPCNTIAYSSDGIFLASGHANGVVALWDVGAGIVRTIFTNHESSVHSVAFSPDGRTLASSSDDSTIVLRDLASGSARLALRGHQDGVWSIAFSPDGNTLASGSSDATVRLWNTNTGNIQFILQCNRGRVHSVAFSPDGNTLASGHEDSTIVLWDITSGSIRATLQGHSRAVRAIVFNPCDSLLATGSDDSTIHLWDIASRSVRFTLEGHRSWVLALAFSPDGAALASGSYDSTVRIWDIASGSPRHMLRGHGGMVRSVAFSPDGFTVASGSRDTTIRGWDVATGSIRLLLGGSQGFVWSIALNRAGSLLATVSNDSTIRLWNVPAASLRQTLKEQARVWSVAFSPDSRMLAAGSDRSDVRLWNVETGAVHRILRGHKTSVITVAFSPDGKILATGSGDTTIRLWDIETGANRLVLNGHQGRVWSVAFGPRGKILASGSADKTIRLWDVEAMMAEPAVRPNHPDVLEGHTSTVHSVAFSIDGSMLASASYDATVQVWDVASKATKKILSGHRSDVSCVAFSPDGVTLASGSDDSTVRLWDVASGKARSVLSGHQDIIISIAFTGDGAILASSAADSTIRLWHTASGTCLATLLCLPEGWVAFTPNGQYKLDGDIARAFWHSVGLCRFEPGDLDPHIHVPLQLTRDKPLFLPPNRVDLIADQIAKPGPSALAGVTTSILARSALSYGLRSEAEDLTVPTNVDPVAAALFEAIVEATFLVASVDDQFGEAERTAFRSAIVAACDNAVDGRQIEALLADCADALDEDGVPRRVQMVAKTVREPLQRVEALRIAALIAHISGGVSDPGRRVLEQLASRFDLPSTAVDDALAQARSVLNLG